MNGIVADAPNCDVSRYVVETTKELLMFKELKELNSRPAPFQFYTADELWTNEHTSKKCLNIT